ncbi:MAG: tetratricopeptide repeat protein [Planctomycetes bacterium]|nr:tetratricopeptide repeat protein [Planctomycetota bacterium]
MDDNLITPSDFFHRGMESLESGNFTEALEYFEAAVQRDYYDADIHLPMAEALFEVGRFQDALDHFNLAGQAGVPANDILLWKGWCYLELGKARRAISAFNRVLEANPNHAEAHFKRGLALSEIGSPDRALEAFESSERILRETIHLGDADHTPEGPDGSGPDVEALAEVLMWKGRTLSRLGRRADGLELMFEAYELAPEHPGPYNEIADSFRFNGDLGSAEDWYKKGLERLPEDPSLHNDYGNLLRELGRYRDSLEHLSVAIDRDANRSVAYYNRALTLERLELFDEALKDYDTVIDANPVDLDAKLRKLDLLTQMGLFNDALELLAELTETERNTVETREAMARMYNRQAVRTETAGDWEGALKAHRAALELHPDFLDVEAPGPQDDGAEVRLQRLVDLMAKVPADHPDSGLAALLSAAAGFTLVRITRSRRSEAEDLGQAEVRPKLESATTGPFPAPAHKLMAEFAFYELKDDELALNHAEAALKVTKDYVGALWIKAVTLSEGKLRPDLAVECYRQMLEITPNNSSVLLNLGDLYFDHGQPHRALSYYRRVLEDRPGDVSINRDIGHCYLALRRYGEAIACFSRLESQGVMQLDVRLDLAEAQLAVGERTEAGKQIEEVLEDNAGLDPNIDARATELSAALMLARRNPKGARKAIKSLEDTAVTTFGMLQLARAEVQLENLDEAWECLNEITDTLDPHAADAVEARYHKARIEFARENRPAAQKVLDEMLAAAPLDERAYRMKGWIHMLEGELEQSDEVEEARKFAIEISKVHRLLQYEDFAEALSNTEMLEQDYPTRIEPKYYKACALAQLGEDDIALDTIRELLAKSPDLKLRIMEEFYLEPLRLGDRFEFREHTPDE